MIVNTTTNTAHESTEQRHGESFLPLLPQVQRYAGAVFRRLPMEAREEAVQETVANAFTAYTRLVARGCADRAHASWLAHFAVAHVRIGRRVGTPMNKKDVMSEYGQRDRPVKVFRCDFADGWQDVLVPAPTRRASTPADQAAFRLDFRSWLRLLSPRNRQLALMLARGERPRNIASHFGVSTPRVAQIRKALRKRWERFHEPPARNCA